MDVSRLSVAGLLESLFLRPVTTSRPAKPILTHPSGSFLLGHQHLHAVTEPVFLAEQDRHKHLYVLGSTGAGKSNLLLRLVEHDFTQGNTAMVLDLRGDLTDRLLVRLARHDGIVDRMRLVDLRQQSLILPFNPLAGPGECTSRALHILGVIKKEAGSWGVQLDESLRHCLLALVETGGTLLDIEPLLTDAAFRAGVLARVRDPYVLAFFNRFGAMSQERQQSWSLPVLNKVSGFWTVPLLRQMLGRAEAPDWQDWLDRPGRLVCIALAAHHLQSAAHLVGALLISSFQDAIMSRADTPERLRNRVVLYVDEFETMASPAFNALIAEGRRFRAGLVLAHQNLGQVDPSLRQTIRNNVHTQVIFQCGSPDAAELASDVIADVPKEVIRRSLLQQRVGQAYLIRRGQVSIPLTTVFSPDPTEPISYVAELRAELLAKTCVPAVPDAGTQKTVLTKEVRHVRRPKV